MRGLSRADRMHFSFLPLLGALLMAVQPAGAQFHVTPGGTSEGDGSPEHPWDLATGLGKSSTVGPGDTLWIHGGTYQGSFTSTLSGTANKPVIVRNYGGQRAVLSSSTVAPVLSVQGSSGWYWGLELASSAIDSGIGGAGGCILFGDGNKLIHCIVHDMLGSGIEDQNCRNTEIYGCVVYYNGRKTNNQNYGYGVYGQSSEGHKFYRDNFFIHNFAAYQIHLYTEQNAIDSFRVSHNVLTNYANSATLLIGGGPHAARDCWIDSNYTYGSESPAFGIVQVAYHEHADLENPKIRGNFFMRGSLIFDSATTGREFAGNFNYGEDPVFSSGRSLETDSLPNNAWFIAPYGTEPNPPTGTWAFVRPSVYEARRANIIVYNWGDSASVKVDAGDVLAPGDSFQILDAQNILGPAVTSGISSDGTVDIPMGGSAMPVPVSYPAALGPPRHTSKRFGTFVVVDGNRGIPAGTGVAPERPFRFSLALNYPNPFNPTTTVSYQLSAGSHVTLRVYDVLGREVGTLVDGFRAPGNYTVKFDGSRLASGVYFSRLDAGGMTATRAMLLVK